MLDCKQVLAELSNYLDGEVSSEVKEAIEKHLAKCAKCLVIYDTARKTLTIVSETGVFEMPLAVSERLHQKLHRLYATP